jgi:hypothetical protein
VKEAKFPDYDGVFNKNGVNKSTVHFSSDCGFNKNGVNKSTVYSCSDGACNKKGVNKSTVHADEHDEQHPLQSLDFLTRDDDKFTFAVAKDKKEEEHTCQYKLIEAVVDSGAEESVAPPKVFPGQVVPSEMSKAGCKYRAANGARIPKLGQQKVSFTNYAGQRCGTTFCGAAALIGVAARGVGQPCRF